MTSTFLDMSHLAMTSQPSPGQLERTIVTRDYVRKFLTLAQEAAADGNRAPETSNGSNDPVNDDHETQNSFMFDHTGVSNHTNIKGKTKDIEHPAAEAVLNSGHFSPKLTYGILPDFRDLPTPNQEDVSVKIMRRCASGQDSFLSRLYWSISVSSVLALRGEAPESARLRFKYSLIHESPENLAIKAYKALQIMLYGRSANDESMKLSTWPGSQQPSSSQINAGEDELLRNLKSAIINDVNQRGKSMDNYIHSTELEGYLLQQWGIMPGTDKIRFTARRDATEVALKQPTLRENQNDSYQIPSQSLERPDMWNAYASASNTVSSMDPPDFQMEKFPQVVPEEVDNSHASLAASAPYELTLGIEKLMEGLNVASVCFGSEMLLEKHAVDQAAISVLQEAAIA